MRRIIFLLLSGVFSFVSHLAAETVPLTIGANLALSGKFAFTGQSQLHGLELAIEEVNRKGGVHGLPVALLTEDNAGDPKQAVTGVNKLLDNEARVFYVGLTHIVQAVKTILKTRNALMLYAAGVSGPAEEHTSFFRDWGDSQLQGKILAEGVRAEGHDSAVFFGEENDACMQVYEGFLNRASELKVKVLKQESYNPGETDFRTVLLRLLSLKPQSIVLCAFRDSGLILTQLKTLGSSTQVFHTFAPFIPVNDTPQMRALYEGNKSLTTWFGFLASEADEKQQQFIKNFTAKFGMAPRIEAMLAYDGMLALLSAAERCPSSVLPHVECIASSLITAQHHGILGELTFDKNRKSRRPEFLMQVVKGEWKRFSPSKK